LGKVFPVFAEIKYSRPMFCPYRRSAAGIRTGRQNLQASAKEDVKKAMEGRKWRK
jgi:hypothetical protein